jgi:hypothetical protein
MLALDLATVAAAVLHAVRADGSSLRRAVILVVVTFVAGLGLTVLGLVHSFAGVAGVDPTMKATLLAKGISEAMNATACGVGALLLWIAPFVVGEVRRSRRRRG